MYLPQYHCIPENDLFWGKGFTDWTTVKNAKPLFKGHQQPRIPISGKYYDLSLEKDVVWQAKLAQEYGIYGFGVYHYWFNNEKNILTKPAEIIRDNEEVRINYYLAWDNANWKRSWSNVAGNDWSPIFDEKTQQKKGPVILIEYILGKEKDWENHFNHLLSHFKSDKYIKVDNQPLFMIYNYDEEIEQMCQYWDKLAIKHGFDGICFIMKIKENIIIPENRLRFKYEPIYSGWRQLPFIRRVENRLRRMFNIQAREYICDYDTIWENLLVQAKADVNKYVLHGGFVGYDDTPRRGKRGTVILGATPLKFQKYLKELLKISSEQDKPFVFITAWNEWGEGAYLEPDTLTGYEYLKSMKEALKK